MEGTAINATEWKVGLQAELDGSDVALPNEVLLLPPVNHFFPIDVDRMCQSIAIVLIIFERMSGTKMMLFKLRLSTAMICTLTCFASSVF